VSRITNSIHQSAGNGARVVVFPECALSGYFEDAVTNLSIGQITVAAQQVADACRQAGVYAIVGSAWREGDKLFDSALVITPTGKVRGSAAQFNWRSAGHTRRSFIRLQD
jgi:predicted amidohydrolase